MQNKENMIYSSFVVLDISFLFNKVCCFHLSVLVTGAKEKEFIEVLSAAIGSFLIQVFMCIHCEEVKNEFSFVDQAITKSMKDL